MRKKQLQMNECAETSNPCLNNHTRNQTMNNSEINEHLTMNMTANYILTCFFLLIAVAGILGNLLVIISVEMDARMRRSLTNRLIVHVACCDLIILLFNIPDIVQFVSSKNGNWVLGEYPCKVVRSILVLAQYASVLTMCVITVERFIGIVYPLRSKFLFHKQHLTHITIFVWTFSFLCTIPNLIYLHVTSISPVVLCCRLQYARENHVDDRIKFIVHKSVESTIFYFIPLLLQIYCYARIAARLSRVDLTLHASLRFTKKHQIHRSQDDVDEQYCSMIRDDATTRKLPITDSFVNLPNENHHQCSQSVDSSFVKCVTVYQNSPLTKDKHHREATNLYLPDITFRALQARRGVIKMLCVVVLIYFISFSPQVLVFILFNTNAIQPAPTFIQTPYFIAFTMLLVAISSASNPIVYAIFSSKFRLSFANIFRR